MKTPAPLPAARDAMVETAILTAGEDLATLCTRWGGNVRGVSLLAAANDADRLRHLPVGTRMARLWRDPCSPDPSAPQAPQTPQG